MVAFTPIRDIIDNALNLDLGMPNKSMSEKENLLKESAISLGCLDYYRSFPFQIVYTTTYNSAAAGAQSTFSWAGMTAPKTENGNLYIPFADFFQLGSPRIPEEQVKHAYFLGIMNMQRPPWNNWSNPGKFSSYMFGFQYGTNYGENVLETILSNTYDDLSTGQPKYWINRTLNRVEVLQPFGMGQLSMIAAVGFTSPEYIDMSRVDFLCKFISKRFVESIIQAREGVQLDTDFTISTEALKARLEKLTNDVYSIQNNSVLHQALWS